MTFPRNDRYYEADNGTVKVNIVSSKGEVLFERPVRSPRQALAEFKVACELWFGCMDPETRARAVRHARDAAGTVPFKPNCEPT